MDNLFKIRDLVAAVNKMRPVRMPVTDRVFGRKKMQATDRFGWDIKSSSERVLSSIRVHESAQAANLTGRKAVTCAAPRFSEKRLISAADLNAMRAFGEQAMPELIDRRIADEQFDMRSDIDRTREFMAVKALSGQVTDGAGTVLVDYGFDAAQKPALAAGAEWDEATGDPIKNIRGWKKWIADRVNVSGFVSFCGSGAMDALINNDNARELLQYSAGQQIAEEGRIAKLAGVSIEEYFGSYKDAAGAIQQMIPDGVFALVGIGADTAAELFAPAVDLEAPGGVGSGAAAQMFFSKSWEDKDPSGRWLKVEARPLPVLFQPECVIWATVI